MVEMSERVRREGDREIEMEIQERERERERERGWEKDICRRK